MLFQGFWDLLIGTEEDLMFGTLYNVGQIWLVHQHMSPKHLNSSRRGDLGAVIDIVWVKNEIV